MACRGRGSRGLIKFALRCPLVSSPARPGSPPIGCASAGQTRARVENLGGWFIKIVARVCLNMLPRNVRREQALDGNIPDPLISPDTVTQPEEEAVLADTATSNTVKWFPWLQRRKSMTGHPAAAHSGVSTLRAPWQNALS
jgi:hypothetical protein